MVLLLHFCPSSYFGGSLRKYLLSYVIIYFTSVVFISVHARGEKLEFGWMFPCRHLGTMLEEFLQRTQNRLVEVDKVLNTFFLIVWVSVIVQDRYRLKSNH